MKTLFRKFLLLEQLVWRFLISSIACSCLISPLAVAQILPDNTLGDESSVVVPDVEINGLKSDRLSLSHSFPGDRAEIKLQMGNY